MRKKKNNARLRVIRTEQVYGEAVHSPLGPVVVAGHWKSPRYIAGEGKMNEAQWS